MCGEPLGTKGAKILTPIKTYSDVIKENLQEREDVSEKACDDENNSEEMILVRLLE